LFAADWETMKERIQARKPMPAARITSYLTKTKRNGYEMPAASGKKVWKT
jgi:hypothetical protein